MTQLAEWKQPPHEDEELKSETTQEQLEFDRLTECRDKGLISNEYYQKFLYETGRLTKKPVAPPAQELSLPAPVEPPEAVRTAAKTVRTSDDGGDGGKTPKPKRVRRPPCTPKLNETHQRIKAGLAACPKHVNGHESLFYN